MRWFDRVLVGLAAIMVIVNLLPLGARLSWVLDLTTHFRLQYLAVTLLVLAVAALRRQWRTVAALAVAGAVSAAPVLPYVPQSGAAAAAGRAPGTGVTVAAVNVSYRQFSARRLLEILGETPPDIVLIVEFTPHAQEVLAVLDTRYPHSFKLPAEGPYGIAIWSRFELDTQPFSLGRLPALEARVQGPGGSFTLLGVHLSAPTSPRRSAQRDQQLELLAAYSTAIAGPVAVAGDFNITPYSPLFTDWLAASGLTDTRRGRTLSISWPALLPALGIPIDHVAVSDEFEILAHRRLPNFDSDHYGIVAELALRDGLESP